VTYLRDCLTHASLCCSLVLYFKRFYVSPTCDTACSVSPRFFCTGSLPKPLSTGVCASRSSLQIRPSWRILMPQSKMLSLHNSVKLQEHRSDRSASIALLLVFIH
jgi:hypothetical protein